MDHVALHGRAGLGTCPSTCPSFSRQTAMQGSLRQRGQRSDVQRAHRAQDVRAEDRARQKPKVQPTHGSSTASSFRASVVRRCAGLTTVDIDLFYAQLRKRGGARGGPLAPASVKRVHAVLRRALAQAVKWGTAHDQPGGERVAAARAASRSLATRSRRRRALDRVRRRERPVRSAASFVSPRHRARAAGNSARCDGSTSIVDKGALLIERSIVENGKGELVEKDTKTHAARRLRLDAGTIDRLQQHRAEREGYGTALRRIVHADDFVFSLDPAGRTPWRPGT